MVIFPKEQSNKILYNIYTILIKNQDVVCFCPNSKRVKHLKKLYIDTIKSLSSDIDYIVEFNRIFFPEFNSSIIFKIPSYFEIRVDQIIIDECIFEDFKIPNNYLRDVKDVHLCITKMK